MDHKIKIEFEKFDTLKFSSNEPFPHIVIDNLFDESLLLDMESSYPKLDDLRWWKYDNHFEKKLAFNSIIDLPACFTEYFNLSNSILFTRRLEKLTGISDLLSDPSLHGGGLHRIEKGGKLDIHADFNYHRITGWRRRLNMITFLNKDWDEDYGGHTEFWNLDMTKCIQKILPIFGRTIIFEVDDYTWHGHPDPLNCPAGVSRKSLATYYYTLHDKNIDNLTYRSTDYKKRPSDADDLDSLRDKRRKGRLKDQTT